MKRDLVFAELTVRKKKKKRKVYNSPRKRKIFVQKGKRGCRVSFYYFRPT